jgi:hypothetical protein
VISLSIKGNQMLAPARHHWSNGTRISEWAKDYWDALHPFSASGAYVNMIMDEGEERVKAAYRDNHARLAQIKAKYDPHNFFHINQNIRPAPSMA